MDADWSTKFEAMLHQEQQLLVQSGEPSATVDAFVHTVRAISNSSEAKAGAVIFTLAVVAVILVLMAMAGGALGARFLTQPRRPRSIS